MLDSLRKFNKSEAAVQRMKIIKFYEEYGERATKEAFGADRKLISRWKHRVKSSQGSLSGLIPYSTRPHKVRHSEIPQEIIAFICQLRQEHPRLGKEKIKPLLDKYCKGKDIQSISESTVGNIIKRHKLFFSPQRISDRKQAGYTITRTPSGHTTLQKGKRGSG